LRSNDHLRQFSIPKSSMFRSLDETHAPSQVNDPLPHISSIGNPPRNQGHTGSPSALNLHFAP
jgi:hypothetical protein